MASRTGRGCVIILTDNPLGRVEIHPINMGVEVNPVLRFVIDFFLRMIGTEVTLTTCLGTAGLMVLRSSNRSERRPLRPRRDARPLRTLAFGAMLRHEQVAVRSSKLTGGHAGALIVDYRETGRASERVFLFMAPPDAEALSGALKAQRHRIATERASQAAEQQQRAGSSRAGSEHTAAKVALMTAKTKARCGQRMWAQMSAEKRTAAVRVMLQSHAAVPSPALSPRRSIAKKARVRPTAAASPGRSIRSSPTHILEYVHPTHGPAVAF